MNTALKCEDEVTLAKKGLDAVGAKRHGTDWKNWDLWDFQNIIVKNVPVDGRVLDVGCASNPLLYNLAELGYKNLHGIDIGFPPGSAHLHPDVEIQYEDGDLTRTKFPFQHFDAISSLSVLEHGIDFDEYLREMSRILKPGGLLLTSTDFWPKKVRTWNVPRTKTFGTSWNILDEDDVDRFVYLASRWGLYQTGRLDVSVGDKVVKWGGKEYTFLSLALRKAQS